MDGQTEGSASFKTGMACSTVGLTLLGSPSSLTLMISHSVSRLLAPCKLLGGLLPPTQATNPAIKPKADFWKKTEKLLFSFRRAVFEGRTPRLRTLVRTQGLSFCVRTLPCWFRRASQRELWQWPRRRFFVVAVGVFLVIAVINGKGSSSSSSKANILFLS